MGFHYIVVEKYTYMKLTRCYLLLTLLLFCNYSNTQAAYRIKKQAAANFQSFTSTQTASENAVASISNTSRVYDLQSERIALPRGRGNGRDALKSCIFGGMAIIPFLGLIFAPFAYIKGIRNMRKKRKYRGFAIAGVIMATIGIALTVLILLAA